MPHLLLSKVHSLTKSGSGVVTVVGAGVVEAGTTASGGSGLQEGIYDIENIITNSDLII